MKGWEGVQEYMYNVTMWHVSVQPFVGAFALSQKTY